jgi:glycosyltransferase involved in cell wall biosynthesis
VPARVLRFEQNRGKGHAVRAGLLAAEAPIALFSDADLSTPIDELPKIVEPIEAGTYDIVFGSRAIDRSLIGSRQPWRREQGGKVFNAIVRLTTGLPFSDTQCGFKAFRMETARPIVEESRIDGFGFDVELLFLAYRAGLRLLEVPVRWNHYEGSKVHIVRDSLRMFSEVVNLRQRVARGAGRTATAGASQ